MIEQIRYVCAYCESAYPTIEECEECESIHEIPVEITEFDFIKYCSKYPRYITVKTANNKLAQYQYVKPIVSSEKEGE